MILLKVIQLKIKAEEARIKAQIASKKAKETKKSHKKKVAFPSFTTQKGYILFLSLARI